jgi:HlyD family secretion protein
MSYGTAATLEFDDCGYFLAGKERRKMITSMTKTKELQLMKKKRTWIIIGIAVVLSVVGVVLVTNNQRSVAQAARSNVQLGRVTQATLLSTVDSSGSVTPESKTTLSFGTSGTISQVTVACNNLDNVQQSYDDAVTAYNNYISNWHVQVNGTADVSPQKARLDSAKAAYDQALASCNLAKSNAGDNSSVQSAYAQLQQAKANLDNLISPSANTIALAKIQLEQANTSLEQAQRQLANAQIVAPFDGVITAVNAEAGASGSGAAIVEADDTSLNVGVLVDETQIAGVKPGQETQLTLDAMPGITLTGKVESIDPAGTISQGVVNYHVSINLDPTTAPVRIDMTANASIIEATHNNVLAVPNAAIRTGGFGGGNRQGSQAGVNVQVGQTVTNTQQNGQGGQPRIQGPSVLVLRNGQPVFVPVTVGLQTADLTEVSGNLQEGDVVLIVTATRTANAGGGGFIGGFGGFPGGGRFGD